MKQQLVKGVAWLTGAKLIVNALGMVSTLILARLLTPDDFGLVAMATTILSIIGSITELSLAAALIHHKNPTDEYYSTAWSLNLTRAIIVGGLFALSGPWVADLYGDQRLESIMIVLGFVVVMSGASNPKIVSMTKKLIFWQEFAISVSQKLLGFIASITIALIFKSYWALIAGSIASQLINILVSYMVISFRPKFTFKHAKELWSFSIWLSLGQIINTLNWKSDHLLVGSYLGNKALGYYTVGDNLSTTPTREMLAPLETTLFPGFSTIGDDKVRLRAAYKKAQTLVAAVAMPVGVGIALISHSVVLVILGEKWIPAIIVMQIMAGSVAMQSLSSAVHPLAMSQGETKLLFKRDLISFAIRVPLIVIGLWYAGLVGILIGRAASTVVSIYMNMTIVKKIIGTTLSAQLLANTRSLLSLCVMIASVLLAQHLLGLGNNNIVKIVHFISFIAIGALAYIPTHYLLWRLQGKPEGPEAEINRMGLLVLTKIRGKRIDQNSA